MWMEAAFISKPIVHDCWLSLKTGSNPALSQTAQTWNKCHCHPIHSWMEPGELLQWLWSGWQHQKHYHGIIIGAHCMYTCGWLKWVSSFLTAHQHIIGYSVPWS